jgi:hypothetical protein
MESPKKAKKATKKVRKMNKRKKGQLNHIGTTMLEGNISIKELNSLSADEFRAIRKKLIKEY